MSHKLGSKIKVEKQYNNAISVSNVFLKPTLMNYEHDLDYCQKIIIYKTTIKAISIRLHLFFITQCLHPKNMLLINSSFQVN